MTVDRVGFAATFPQGGKSDRFQRRIRKPGGLDFRLERRDCDAGSGRKR